MSEMNREEAIKDITDNVLPCVGGKSLKMAISDMEKLQKIEEIVDEMWDENSYYNNTVRFAEKIEQIVRGE